MNSSEKYYREKIYPLQDGVMRTINALNTPFFLTGGTALSRHYFNHRYSDDLDLFVNNCGQFQDIVDVVLNKLNDRNPFLIEKETLSRSENHTQLFVSDMTAPAGRLKIDLVNDRAPHFGKNEKHTALGNIDSWENILSNKITALFRFEPKDITDIWVIARNKKFDWKQIIREAKIKEAGVEPEEIFNIIKSFPIKELDLIRWIKKPDYFMVQSDLQQIAEDIFYGRKNEISRGGCD